MKKNTIDRLLRQAGVADEAPAEMPFGFDTRVLALVRERAQNGSSALVALFARRASAIALIVIGMAAIGVYQSADSAASSDLSNDYALTDTAIENNLSE